MEKILIIMFLGVFGLNAQTKAFPTAQGYGKYATGGRGGDIYHVTNLNDSGAGSLRYGIDRGDGGSGARTIVFDVGGDINITGIGIIISAGLDGDLTIAGETAPFPGITLRGDSISGASAGGMLDIRDGNVIIRYISLRVHDGNLTDYDSCRIINTTTGTMSNIILDHVSMSHGSDEIISVVGSSGKNVSNVTIQNSMFGNSQTTYNFLMGERVYDLTLYNNYMSHMSSRNPFIGWGTADEEIEIINNVIYATNGTTNIAYGNHVDLIGNVYTESDDLVPAYRAVSYEVNSFNNPTAVESDGSLYVADNFFDGAWSAGTYQSSVATYAKATRRLTDSEITSWASTQTDIENQVFNNVGNSIYRDALDSTLIADYSARTGNTTSITPPTKTLSSRNMATEDTDSDDMLDVAEIAVFGSISVTDNPIGDTDGDGYTDIEETFFYFTGESDNIVPAPPTFSQRKRIKGSQIKTSSGNATIFGL